MSVKQSPRSFWAKVNKKAPNGCWEWAGTLNSTGYGTVGWEGKNYTAHRVAAWLSCMVDSRSAPERSYMKTHVLHKCDNRKCCNPKHLFLGSKTDNMFDMYTKKRRVQPKGQHHSNAKLTDKQAAIIRERYKNGELQVPLAKEYGVSQVAISLIVRGVTYA